MDQWSISYKKIKGLFQVHGENQLERAFGIFNFSMTTLALLFNWVYKRIKNKNFHSRIDWLKMVSKISRSLNKYILFRRHRSLLFGIDWLTGLCFETSHVLCIWVWWHCQSLLFLFLRFFNFNDSKTCKSVIDQRVDCWSKSWLLTLSQSKIFLAMASRC